MPSWISSVEKFCYQYLQLESDPALPPPEFLKLSEVQEAIYETVLAESVRHGPPVRYQLRVLKSLIAAIEASIDDWEEYGISDKFMSATSLLLNSPLPAEIDSAQQKCHVTYMLSLLSPKTGGSSGQEPGKSPSRPTITLLENRSLLSAGGTTGLRTWEAALHLGQYLCEHRDVVRGKRVLELGTGTGYLSILCVRYLGATHVLASDGSDDVVSSLADSLCLNGLQEEGGGGGELGRVVPMHLEWGHALSGTKWRHRCKDNDDDGDDGGVDVVLGADITYDASVIPALVATLAELLDLYPGATVYLSATQRNYETFGVFVGACRRSELAVQDLRYGMTARHEQQGPFYSDAVEIRACKIACA